jgi:hypothetical protein
MRLFTPSEEHGLTDAQKGYLQAHPNITSLQPQMLAREALYQTQHGAVTIDRAMELDMLFQQIKVAQPLPVADNYSDAEDAFIEQHGMSSGLF